MCIGIRQGIAMSTDRVERLMIDTRRI